jgi:hypothetical protein
LLIQEKKMLLRKIKVGFWISVFCIGAILPRILTAQSSSSTAVVMVEIQCKPGTADQWRDSFTKEILPSIQEAIRKGDGFTNFSLLEAPLPAQNVDFVLLFETKSFSSLDVRRVPPHYEALFQRLGPERAESVLKLMGELEQRVTVSIFRDYKVQP